MQPATRENVFNMRLQAWGREACEFDKHIWVRFSDPQRSEVVALILCSACGRTPNEALATLPVVVP